MLKSFRVQRFKSLEDSKDVPIAPLTVLFGANASGKSNFLDAIQVLSRVASERTLADALGGPVRGLALEAFTFPKSGLPGLLKSERASFRLEADLMSRESNMRYQVEIGVHPKSGVLSVDDENLVSLDRHGQARGEPRIGRSNGKLVIRRKSKPGRPLTEQLGLGFSQVSDRRFSGVEYRAIERAREELSSWRTYYLDPRVAMRAPQSPQEVDDIGSERCSPTEDRAHRRDAGCHGNRGSAASGSHHNALAHLLWSDTEACPRTARRHRAVQRRPRERQHEPPEIRNNGASFLRPGSA